MDSGFLIVDSVFLYSRFVMPIISCPIATSEFRNFVGLRITGFFYTGRNHASTNILSTNKL